MEGLQPGALAGRWAQSGYAPLELVAELPFATRLVRLAAPGRQSWVRRGRTWCHAPSRQLLAFLSRTPALVGPVRLLIVERGRPLALGVLYEAEVADPWSVTGWLGWPDIPPLGPAGPTTAAALAARSNDYRPLDHAAEALGLGPMDTFRARSLPWRGGISVILPARGVHEVLPDVLSALAGAASRLTPDTPWEAIVVDDADDPPVRLPTGLPPQIRLVHSADRLYSGGARNLGMAHSRYELLVFCDADTHLAPDYLQQHVARHLVAPNLITVSLREQVPGHLPLPDRAPDGRRDTRSIARYEPGRVGLTPVTAAVTIYPLAQTHGFREFGHGQHLGPVDLPFMVKGNNLALPASTARPLGFPPEFVGWGPEDMCFAAKLVARGSYVVPVLSTGVFHRAHPPRSGSPARRDAELATNLAHYARRLDEPAAHPWQLLQQQRRAAL
ncbi:glycosyltransferase [Streptomyces sp. AK02-01A]|uniref:glycosyltransferase n=1 Tax=Streptomyces sp. AK02-01A TaxID=3028648 RepID=UPI0029BC8DD9|nr:glycosyltransferase [Streptomyces sp. AK02-01A]MDX3854215.1 glycosyltransferase [Streptomyces sp. AK02-01A]